MSQLSVNINTKSLLKFTLPSMVLMLFMSFYVMVDGMFVAKYVGAEGLAAINITYPVMMVMVALGFMFGMGGGALCAIKLGEGKNQEAKEDFTSLVLISFVTSIIFAIGVIYSIKDIIFFLGGTEEIYTLCYDYLYYMTIFSPFLLGQVIFQSLLVTAGRPNNAFLLTFVAGITNIILDYIFIAILGWGIAGASIATGIGELFATLYGAYCFFYLKDIQLSFTKPKVRMGVIVSSMVNGSSEMVSQMSYAITTYLFNITILRLAGTDGVAAITIILYSQFILGAVYFGYSGGMSPLISYNYGSKNVENVRKLFKISLVLIGSFAICVLFFAQVFASELVSVFSEKGTNVHTMATEGLRIFALCFIFSGFNIYSSALFTAFSNGKISALISFLRTFIFITVALLTLPNVIGITGVWMAVPLAEILAAGLVVYFLKRYRNVYNYY